MKETKIRSIVITFLLLTFILTVLSRIVLLFLPHGRWSGYYVFLGLTKYEWKNIHIYSGIIMLVLALIHFYLNRKLYIYKLRTLIK